MRKYAKIDYKSGKETPTCIVFGITLFILGIYLIAKGNLIPGIACIAASLLAGIADLVLSAVRYSQTADFRKKGLKAKGRILAAGTPEKGRLTFTVEYEDPVSREKITATSFPVLTIANDRYALYSNRCHISVLDETPFVEEIDAVHTSFFRRASAYRLLLSIVLAIAVTVTILFSTK